MLKAYIPTKRKHKHKINSPGTFGTIHISDLFPLIGSISCPVVDINIAIAIIIVDNSAEPITVMSFLGTTSKYNNGKQLSTALMK